MTPVIQPVSDAWLYTYVLQPHLEGVERLNRVWSGIDTSSAFETKKFSWLDRIVYLISGLALLIPLVATIVWTFMNTFGHPDQLSESYHIARDSLLDSPIL